MSKSASATTKQSDASTKRQSGHLERQAEQQAAHVTHGVTATGLSSDRLENSHRLEQRRQVSAAAASSAPPAGGSPLPMGFQRRMESAFDASLAQVRVHTDPAAAQRSQALGARAYTVADHISFGAREYQPQSDRGQALIAHEVAHTLQQQAGAQGPQCAPDEAVIEVIIFLDTKEALVRTDLRPDGYRYALTDDKGLKVGLYRWSHTKGTTVDKGKDAVLERPADSTGQINWRIAGAENQPGWPDFADSTFDMQVIGSSSLGGGKGTKGSGSGDGSGGKKSTGSGSGSKAEPTDAEKEAQADKFNKKLAAKAGTGAGGLSKDKLKELVGDWTDQQIDEFMALGEQAQSENPDMSMEELLKWFGKLTESQREILRVNKMMADATGGEAGPLPENIQLMIKTDAQAAVTATEKLNDTNASLNAIRSKIADPDRAKNFEPLDPQTLTAFNEMMMLEALLAGATERSPNQIGPVAKELMANIGKIRDFILEELAWLAAEVAATTLLAALAAPFSGGTSAVAGAAAAAHLVLRINQLRKLLQTVMKIKAAVDTVKQLKSLFDRLRALTNLKSKFEKYQTQMDRLLELQQLLRQSDTDVSVHDDVEKLEDELFELMQKMLEEDEFGEVLDFLYLPDDATEDDLRQILLDLPRGIGMAEEMMGYYSSMKSGDLEATKTLMFKSFGVGYLLYPVVGFIAGKANEQLNALMAPQSIGDRLFGVLSRGPTGFGKGRKHNKDRLSSVKKKDRTKKPPQAAKKKDDDPAAVKDKESDKKKDKDKDKDKAKAPTAEDLAWERLKLRITALPNEFPDGVISEELLKRARQIKSEADFKKVAGGADVDNDTAKPSHWRLTVKRKDVKGKVVVGALKTEVTRYKDLRKAIMSAFRTVKDENRTKEWLEGQLTALKTKYQYSNIKLEDGKPGDDGKPMDWKISGALPGKTSFSEIVSVDAPGNHWGSRTKPVDVVWPKPAIDDYPTVLVGPYVKKKVDIAQSELLTLKAQGSAEREAFGQGLVAKDASLKADVDQWVTDGAKIEEYSPTSRKSLPYGTKYEIGVTTDYQVRSDFRFKLNPQGGTPGGAKINDQLANYGYSSTVESQAGDHVVEYALGGPDDRKNLWPLDASVNSGSGAILNTMRFTKPGTTETVTMKQLKGKAGKPGKQNEVWFRIASVKSTGP